MVAGIPVWVVGAVGLIFFSGIMAFRAMYAERQLENQFIEREGSIFIERMEAERAARSQRG